MPSKKQNKLKVAKSGRVELVKEIVTVQDEVGGRSGVAPKEKLTRDKVAFKAKDRKTLKKRTKKASIAVEPELVESESDEADDDIDLKECESKISKNVY